MNLEDIIKILPIITAFIGAILAYVFGNRKSKNEQFHKDALQSLTDFYSPVFHEMRKIYLNLDIYEDRKVVEMIDEFVNTHTSKETNIFKSCNPNINQLFYDLEEEIYKSEDLYKEDAIIKLFRSLYLTVKDEYWDISKSLYNDFPWYKYLNKTNPILRALLGISKLFYDISKFMLGLCAFLFYIRIFSNIFDVSKPPEWIMVNLKDFSILFIYTYILALSMSFPYYLSKINYKKQTKYTKKFDKIFYGIIETISKKIKHTYNIIISMWRKINK